MSWMALHPMEGQKVLSHAAVLLLLLLPLSFCFLGLAFLGVTLELLDLGGAG